MLSEKLRAAAEKVKNKNSLIKDATKNQVRVGIPADAPDYPDGTDVVMVATVHEYGSEAQNIPPKRFIRSTIENNRNEYRSMLVKYGNLIVDRGMSINQALGLIGEKVRGDIQMTIGTEKFERWAYSNKNGRRVKKKNSEGDYYKESGPLIDTGHLRNSISYKVN